MHSDDIGGKAGHIRGTAGELANKIGIQSIGNDNAADLLVGRITD